MKRKISFLVIMALMVTALCACGGGADDTTNNGGTNTEATVNSETDGDGVAAKVDTDLEDVETEETEQEEMSAEAAAYLDKIREIAKQVNAEREEAKKQYPNADGPAIVEAESKDGLEFLTNFHFRFDDDADDDLEMMRIFFRVDVYDKYYIEYVRETSSSVEFNIYCTKQ